MRKLDNGTLVKIKNKNTVSNFKTAHTKKTIGVRFWEYID